jgi:hypothetical protein
MRSCQGAQQAHPGGVRQVYVLEIQVSPQGWPFEQYLQHAASRIGGSGLSNCIRRSGRSLGETLPGLGKADMLAAIAGSATNDSANASARIHMNAP